MKILLTQSTIYVPSIGGANKGNRLLLEALAERGHSCLAVTPASGLLGFSSRLDFLRALTDRGIRPTFSGPDVEVFHYNGVEVHAVWEGSLVRHFLHQVHEFDPTWILVSAEDPRQMLLTAALKARPSRVIYLALTTLALPFGPSSALASVTKTKLLGEVAGIAAISDYVKEYILRWSGLESTPLPISPLGSGPFQKTGHFDQGFITMINPCAIKGLPIFQALAQSLPQVEFAAVPTWGTTHAERSALGKLPNVSLLEPTDDIDEILARTRILLVPSLCAEAYGRIAVEGMLRGIPVLASNVGGLPEAKLGVDYVLPVNPIEQYENGLDDRALPIPVVPEQDIGPWSKALQRLLTDKAHYDQLSAASREAALSFVSSRTIHQFEIYLETLSPS